MGKGKGLEGSRYRRRRRKWKLTRHQQVPVPSNLESVLVRRHVRYELIGIGLEVGICV